MDSTAFKPLWTQVNGLAIFAQVSTGAPDDARDVVLVHGLGLSGTYLMPTARELARDYRVWVPDLPGFGRSGKPRRVWDVSELADGLADWMDAVGLGKVALLGNSFGCQIIVEGAARHPQHVERAVLQGPTTTPEERSWFWQFVRWRQNPNPGMSPIAHQDYRAAGIYRVLRTFQYSLKHRPEDRLPEIGIPVLVIRGSADPICRPEWAEEVVRRLPRGELVIVPGVHHTMVYQNALELAEICHPFLNGQNKRPNDLVTALAPAPESSSAPLAGFDSASAMARATGASLHGRGFPMVGLSPRWGKPLIRAAGAGLNALPASLKQQFYSWSGWGGALRASQLGEVRSGQLARWAVAQYPRRSYPAAMIGASNGALVHLCAALGIPWLPQTFLIPVKRSGVDANDPQQALDWGRAPGAWLLDTNPDLALYHMHDPNQDQLMIRRMGYFRVKFRELHLNYRRFLAQTLPAGATLFVVDCRLRWPSVAITERHRFQRGALGGATPEEYLHGSSQVSDFLQRQGTRHRSWQGPEPDAETPEAEWGFDPALDPDLEAFARERKLRLRRIVFEHPEDVSALVAELYRDWYRGRGLAPNRLLVSSFILMDPYWTLRTGSVPYWSVFNVEPAAAMLQQYLETTEHYDEIHLMLFSNGVESVGQAPLERWKSLMGKARRGGALIGVDERSYPRDFAVFARYHRALQRTITARHPLPDPLTLEQLETFLERAGERYRVRWDS